MEKKIVKYKNQAYRKTSQEFWSYYITRYLSEAQDTSLQAKQN